MPLKPNKLNISNHQGEIMTFSKKSLATIQADIIRIQADVNHAFNTVESQKANFTKEGAQKSYSNWLNQYKVPQQVERARRDVQKWRDSAQAKADEARVAMYPKPNDATEQIATEMAVSRIMARDGFNRESLLNLCSEMDYSPTRSLLIEESIARGVISSEEIEGYSKQTNDEYHALVNQAQKAATLANMVDKQLDFVERKSANMYAQPGATESVNVADLEGAEVEY